MRILQFFRQEAELRLLLRHMHLQQHIHHTPHLGGSLLNILQMLQAVHSVNHAHKGDVILQLLALQVTDEMPLDILGQHGSLVTQLRGVVLAEKALTCIVSLHDIVHRLQFRDGNEARPRRQRGANPSYVLCNHALYNAATLKILFTIRK